MEFVSAGHGCPNCGGSNPQVFHRVPAVPVNVCLLFDDRKEAQALERGDVDLSFCADCQFIYNASWKPDRITYSEQYEETQAFSPTFSDYQRRQAEELLSRYALFGKEIVEIGCGKGEFLSLLCELGKNRGVGYDPSFVPSRRVAGNAEIEFKREFFGPDTLQPAPDLVCCKMTLEHIQATGRFAETLRRIVSPERGTIVLIQVPDVRRILAEAAFWDVYYEHCSYFSPSSLSRLLSDAGFEVLRIGAEFGGQYLTVEARAARALPIAASATVNGDHEDLAGPVAHFSQAAAAEADRWGEEIRAMSRAGGRTVLWGSGSKAVAFMAAVKAEDHVQYLVDINPHRWGKFVPGSGAEIVPPDFLASYRPSLVIAMNPIYEVEIKRDLVRLGCGDAMFRAVGAESDAPHEGGFVAQAVKTPGASAALQKT